MPDDRAASGAFDPVLLKSTYRRQRDEAIDAFRVDHRPDRLVRKLCRVTDDTVIRIWRHAAVPGDALLAAVGGYGRGEIFPHSDVDLLVLTREVPTPEQAQAIEQFIGACWDAGLEIGHSVRSLAECVAEAEADITVQTSAMEARLLAGSQDLCTELGKHLDATRDARAYFRAKVLEMRQRHVKYEDTPYSLEPNTKESPGGLRDLHVIAWTARAAGFGNSWRELAEHGLASEEEVSALQTTQATLTRIRACLHMTAGRREDRLVFDLQAQVAQVLGFKERSARLASEEMMQRYYWAAKQVTQLTAILLQNLEAALFPQPGTEPEPIDGEFQNRQGLLDAIDPALFEREPSAILRAFLTMTRHPELQGMSAPTLRAIWHARLRIDDAFRREPSNRALFLDILKAPRGVTHAVRWMNQWSVLGHYIPAFRRIVGRMQHDLFHVYTVDQHILMVVRNLRRFQMDEHAHEYPFCSQLAATFDKPWLLYVAALFHDIAKGRGGDHSELGTEDARTFCRAHGLTEDETEFVVFLVRHHLTMSTVAQKQDLADPDVVARFAELAGSVERLTALYLLTVADIRGTSPKVWNAWKGKLLQDLYQLAKRVLSGEMPDAQPRLEEMRLEARRILNLYALSEERYARLWEQLDVAYFLRNDASDVAWQTRVLHRQVDTREPVVRTRLAPIGEGFQVVVYMPDQPGLFARICGYFDRRNLSVLDARIHTTRHGYALDSFLVVDPASGANYRDILQLVEADLGERLRQEPELAPPVRGRASRRSRYFPIRPTIDLRPDDRGQHYILAVTANDRTGLLYGIARILAQHGLNLHTARIATLGERVEDIFLIDGPALANEREQLKLEKDLLAELQS